MKAYFSSVPPKDPHEDKLWCDSISGKTYAYKSGEWTDVTSPTKSVNDEGYVTYNGDVFNKVAVAVQKQIQLYKSECNNPYKCNNDTRRTKSRYRSTPTDEYSSINYTDNYTRGSCDSSSSSCDSSSSSFD